MPDHAPLPWKKLPGNHGAWSAIIVDAEGDAVVEEITADDAELIIKAVNSRTVLIKACQRAEEWIVQDARIQSGGMMTGFIWEAVNILREAIKAAG
jgi:cellulose synthase/poly-beta-1,6-N-acetylglucosamine synthase-like glycosyltransferase